MTIGQRIAQQRKELNLSQEALGEQLGVSRQSIYKWESDTALPEIDKLIALSRLFGVSVGWLLGVEEERIPEETAKTNAPELTEQQLHMVQEIVDRYIAAQPKPQTRKKWPWVLTGLVLVIVLFNLFNRLEDLRRQYNNLQDSVSHIDQNVGHQIGGISNRVEEILKQQNNLTAEYDVTHLSDDYAANLAHFSAYAVPKTYVAGMTAAFVTDNGIAVAQTAAAEQERKFSADLSVELTDMISVSVVFTYPDGTMQTQLLNSFEYLYSDSMPMGDLSESLMFAPLKDDHTLQIPAADGTPLQYIYYNPNSIQNAERVADVRVGLFLNQKLLAWAQAYNGQPPTFQGFDGWRFYELPPLEITLKPGNRLCAAAIVTDIYGRRTVFPGFAYEIDTERQELIYSDESGWDIDVSHWDF